MLGPLSSPCQQVTCILEGVLQISLILAAEHAAGVMVRLGSCWQCQRPQSIFNLLTLSESTSMTALKCAQRKPAGLMHGLGHQKLFLWPSNSSCCRCRGKAGQLLAVPDLLNLSKPTPVTAPTCAQPKPAGLVHALGHQKL